MTWRFKEAIHLVYITEEWLPRKETCFCVFKDSDSCSIIKHNWYFPPKHTSELFGHSLQHHGTNDYMHMTITLYPLLWSRFLNFEVSSHNPRCKLHHPPPITLLLKADSLGLASLLPSVELGGWWYTTKVTPCLHLKPTPLRGNSKVKASPAVLWDF